MPTGHKSISVSHIHQEIIDMTSNMFIGIIIILPLAADNSRFKSVTCDESSRWHPHPSHPNYVVCAVHPPHPPPTCYAINQALTIVSSNILDKKGMEFSLVCEKLLMRATSIYLRNIPPSRIVRSTKNSPPLVSLRLDDCAVLWMCLVRKILSMHLCASDLTE
jgi:hypothetical protein